jgi:environmental stress-induced protein Ves
VRAAKESEGRGARATLSRDASDGGCGIVTLARIFERARADEVLRSGPAPSEIEGRIPPPSPAEFATTRWDRDHVGVESDRSKRAGHSKTPGRPKSADHSKRMDRPSRSVLHLTSADVVEQPWKNGRGVTHELAIWPPGASLEHLDFDWRISRSAVEESGPFSKFAGFDRVLVVTRGAGLTLTHGDEAPRTRLRAHEPYRFSGAWPTRCELSTGAVEDLNVIFRAAGCTAHVEVSRLHDRRRRDAIGPGHAFAHVLSGRATVRITSEEEPFELETGESLWAQSLAREEEIDIAGGSDDTVVVLIGITEIESD